MAIIDWISSGLEYVEEKVEAPSTVENPYIPVIHPPFHELTRRTRVWLWIPKWIAIAFADELLDVEDMGTLFSHECGSVVDV